MGGQPRPAHHPWRHPRGADRSRRRLGDGEAHRPRRADHRHARRLSQAGAARRPHREGPGGALRVASCHRRGAHCRPRRQAPGERPRHLSDRAASPRRHDGAGSAISAISSAATATWPRSRSSISAARRAARIHLRGLDGMANGVARALAARTTARRPRRDPVGQPRRISRRFLGIMRAGLVAVPVNFKLPRADHRFHPARFRRQAGVVRCGARGSCPPDIPGVLFGARFRGFLDPGPFDAVAPLRREPAMFLYTSGSTRPAEGRRAVASEPSLGGRRCGSNARADRQRFLVAAPLYHMNALALATLAARRSHDRAAAAASPRELHRGDRALPLRPCSPRCRR